MRLKTPCQKTVVAGLDVRPIRAAHLTLLQQIDSPVLDLVFRQALNSTIADLWRRAVDPEDIYEAIFILTRPVMDSRAVLSLGREQFRLAVLLAIADQLTPGQVAELGSVITARLRTAIEARFDFE